MLWTIYLTMKKLWLKYIEGIKVLLTLRIDVDYAYPSRLKSFYYTWKKKTVSERYLSYSKLLANLFNASDKEMRVYWFFTPYTLPDKELLDLLTLPTHIIGLHVANDASSELLQLQSITDRRIEYYTVHGTNRLLSQLIWHRKLGQKQAVIPDKFKLKSFHDYPTQCLDWLCYKFSTDEAIGIAKEWISKNFVLEIHPDWVLNSGGRLNNRGPYIHVLRKLLFM